MFREHKSLNKPMLVYMFFQQVPFLTLVCDRKQTDVHILSSV